MRKTLLVLEDLLLLAKNKKLYGFIDTVVQLMTRGFDKLTRLSLKAYSENSFIAPVNDAFAKSIGADIYTPDAASAAEAALAAL